MLDPALKAASLRSSGAMAAKHSVLSLASSADDMLTRCSGRPHPPDLPAVHEKKARGRPTEVSRQLRRHPPKITATIQTPKEDVLMS